MQSVILVRVIAWWSTTHLHNTSLSSCSTETFPSDPTRPFRLPTMPSSCFGGFWPDHKSRTRWSFVTPNSIFVKQQYLWTSFPGPSVCPIMIGRHRSSSGVRISVGFNPRMAPGREKTRWPTPTKIARVPRPRKGRKPHKSVLTKR